MNDVLKKDLWVLFYLVVFGGATYFSKKYIVDDDLMNLVFGGAVNYIVYRIKQELTNSGYFEALKK